MSTYQKPESPFTVFVDKLVSADEHPFSAKDVSEDIRLPIHPEWMPLDEIAKAWDDLSFQVTSDHQVGDEATHLSVIVNEMCTAEVYVTEALHTLVTRVTAQEASRRLGAGYMLSGDVQTTIIASTVKDPRRGTIIPQVKGAGTWSYRFNVAQLQGPATLIAGKSRTQASRMLLRLAGVRHVVMTVSGGGTTLPRDARDIHVLVL